MTCNFHKRTKTSTKIICYIGVAFLALVTAVFLAFMAAAILKVLWLLLLLQRKQVDFGTAVAVALAIVLAGFCKGILEA